MIRYSRLFIYLVKLCSSQLYPANIESRQTARTVGILDIFGFESFPDNSFEQLLINYANEKLQHYFLQVSFSQERALYIDEGLTVSVVFDSIDCNCLELLEGTGRNGNVPGIFQLLDEDVRLGGEDQRALRKINLLHSGKSDFFHNVFRTEGCFCVAHYAGKVTYNIDGFAHKNRDFVKDELLSLLATSECSLISNLFREDAELRSKETKASTMTLALKFQAQISSVINSLNRSTPHFIRCIKPNNSMKPHELNPRLTLEQMKTAGLVEALRVRALGLPVRMTMEQFARRYLCVYQQLDSAQSSVYVDFADQQVRSLLISNEDVINLGF
jgi:myosin-5